MKVSLAPPGFAGAPAPEKGWGTLGQPVFGIYERDSAVYTELVTDCPAKTLQAIIRGKLSPGSIVHSDGCKGCDGLVMLGTTSIFASEIQTPWKNRFISTALRRSGALQDVAWQGLMA